MAATAFIFSKETDEILFAFQLERPVRVFTSYARRGRVIKPASLIRDSTLQMKLSSRYFITRPTQVFPRQYAYCQTRKISNGPLVDFPTKNDKEKFHGSG